jgi:hypothetical protein
MRSVLSLLVFVGFLVPATSFADDEWATPITSLVEVRLSPFSPAIDDEFEGQGPYAAVFDNRAPYGLEIEYDRQVYRGIGSFAIGLHAGWTRVKGAALAADGTDSPDDTRLLTFPLRLSAVYRFDWLQSRFNVPFVLAFKVGLDSVLWSVRGEDGVADWQDADGNDYVGRGMTNGWHAGVGVHLNLDWFAPGMARSFDVNAGVNNTYLFAEYLMTSINDFGGAESWDLSESKAVFGIAFEF